MKITIIGAGPAGLFLAERLARKGHTVAIFDHRSPWEKPCGGAVTQKAFREFPEIHGLTTEWHQVKDLNLITGAGAEIPLTLTRPFLPSRGKLSVRPCSRERWIPGLNSFPKKL